MRRETLRFLAWSSAAALAAGLAGFPLALARGPVSLQFGLLGWGLLALAGTAGGAWVVSRHGSAGVAFPLALGVCILTRLTCLVVGAFLAATWGKEAVGAYLAGFFLGYVPTQAVEVIWFLRSRPQTLTWEKR